MPEDAPSSYRLSPFTRRYGPYLQIDTLNGTLEAIKFLLSREAKVGITDQWSCTLLQLANLKASSGNNYSRIAVALIGAGANIESVSLEKMLMAAVGFCHVKAVKASVAKGADVLAPQREAGLQGYSAVSLAQTREGSEELLQAERWADRTEGGREKAEL